MILISGQRFRTAAASFSPSMLPGMSIGKHDLNIAATGEHGDGLVGIGGLEHMEAKVIQAIRNVHPQQRLIFDDENGDG